MELKLKAKQIIDSIIQFQEEAKDCFDEQFFLDFQDELNRLSLDPNRV